MSTRLRSAIGCATAIAATATGVLALAPTPALAATGQTIVLQNGWAPTIFGTRNPQATASGGIVTLEGALSGGTSSQVFTLAPGYRPTATVYVPVALCNAAEGRLQIDPSGVVNVLAPGGLGLAQCFLSLDGVSFSTKTTGFTPLTLQNGWVPGGYGSFGPAAKVSNDIVRLMGSVASGASAVITTLPPAMRPASNVYVPVDLCNGNDGMLRIQPTGVMRVLTSAFGDAQCFTSLDGVAFSIASGFTSLTLLNNWTASPLSTGAPAVKTVSGIVRFQGAIAGGTDISAFTVPAAVRPAANVYATVTTCNGQRGRVIVTPNGAVLVESAGGFAEAACFTSLDGVSYPLAGFSPIALQNGWTGGPFGTSQPSVGVISGVVHLKGAIANGTTGLAFTLPAPFRPPTDVYVPVSLCNATNGRLYIQPNGNATVVAENVFADAQCFTSLDGVSFVEKPSGFTTLALQNGWTGGAFGTAVPQAKVISGNVVLRGAMAGGTANQAFTLPVSMRPSLDVYVPVDLCNGAKGRLYVSHTTGSVGVYPLGTFGAAQCFTSLEGVSFGLGAGYKLFPVHNGWTGGAFGTNLAAAKSGSVVYLFGAIAGGATGLVTTLPTAYRPATDTYVQVDLCNGNRGRLYIQPNGTLSVQAETAFIEAQCFTSLDGVSYVP